MNKLFLKYNERVEKERLLYEAWREEEARDSDEKKKAEELAGHHSK